MSNLHSLAVVIEVLAAIFVPQLLVLYISAPRNSAPT
jgi:hypothetical protein